MSKWWHMLVLHEASVVFLSVKSSLSAAYITSNYLICFPEVLSRKISLVVNNQYFYFIVPKVS